MNTTARSAEGLHDICTAWYWRTGNSPAFMLCCSPAAVLVVYGKQHGGTAGMLQAANVLLLYHTHSTAVSTAGGIADRTNCKISHSKSEYVRTGIKYHEIKLYY